MKECTGMKGCGKKKDLAEFYSKDSTCKDCRKAAVRANRKDKSDYYREYDKRRFKEDPRVIERHKRYQATTAGKLSSKKSRQKWKDDNSIKKGAFTMVNNAVRDKRIHKPDTCSECGAGGRIHGHHDDYAFPLTVRWLCPMCHTAWHMTHGSGLNG